MLNFQMKMDKSLKQNFQRIFNQKQKHKIFRNKCVADFKVADLQKKPAKKSPAAPFTTSTLQQEASRKLYFSVSKTMTMAQRFMKLV